MNIRKCKSGTILLILFLVAELLICLVGADWDRQTVLRDWRFSSILCFAAIACALIVFVLLLMKKRNSLLLCAFAALSILKGYTLYTCINAPQQFYGNWYESWYGYYECLSDINYASLIPELLVMVALLLSTLFISIAILRSKDLHKVTWIPCTFLFLAAVIRIAGSFDIVTPYYNETQLLLQGISLILLAFAMMFILNWASNPYEKPATEQYAVTNGYVRLIKHILLLLFTFGIWQFIWIYRTTRFLNCVKGEEQRSPTAKLLMCIFIPFYTIYWTYQTARRTDRLAAEKGIYSEIAKPCLLCAFLVTMAAPILIQEKINTCVQSNSNQPSESSKVPLYNAVNE